MSLDIQILSLLFSFIYGVIISYLYNLNYNFIYYYSILYKVVINILFCIDASLIYFLLIKVINYGVIHIYFVFSFLIGFFVFSSKYKFLRNIIKSKKLEKKWFLRYYYNKE